MGIIDAFEELLKEESRVLVDTSALSKTAGNSILTAMSFEDMNRDELDDSIELLRRYDDATKSEKIVAIPEVVDEILRFEDGLERHNTLIVNKQAHRKIISNKISYHLPYRRVRIDVEDEEHSAYPESRKRRFSQEKRQLSENASLYKSMTRYLKVIRHNLEERLLTIDDRLLYEDLVNFVIDLNNVRGIKKKDTTSRGRYVYADLHTDEKLVGAAIYLVTRDSYPVAIATSDRDITLLLENTFQVLGSVEWLNGGYQLEAHLRETPVRVYFLPAGRKMVASTAYTQLSRKIPTDIDLEKTQQLIQRLTARQLQIT